MITSVSPLFTTNSSLGSLNVGCQQSGAPTFSSALRSGRVPQPSTICTTCVESLGPPLTRGSRGRGHAYHSEGQRWFTKHDWGRSLWFAYWLILVDHPWLWLLVGSPFAVVSSWCIFFADLRCCTCNCIVPVIEYVLYEYSNTIGCSLLIRLIITDCTQLIITVLHTCVFPCLVFFPAVSGISYLLPIRQ